MVGVVLVSISVVSVFSMIVMSIFLWDSRMELRTVKRDMGYRVSDLAADCRRYKESLKKVRKLSEVVDGE